MADDDSYNSSEYKSWRFHCLKRDDFQCVLTGKKGVPLEVHHIIPWSKVPQLRYVVSNGITLCKEMHDMVTGREVEFEEQFKKLVAAKSKREISQYKSSTNIKSINEKKKWRPTNPRFRL